jgi:hypothetical protein
MNNQKEIVNHTIDCISLLAVYLPTSHTKSMTGYVNVFIFLRKKIIID